ncbi:COQ9 family protein [Henriciella barbarensis]|uniref:COQ9 family protein n=1 Tax=Henriciella barbarensis TaxID=86342 RepID=A0A399R292_9PROT|nr:COQ9 family protein [Henriciella barbarensis]RIJ24335.1 COQ9 family protein [Henriciella barbarensis]
MTAQRPSIRLQDKWLDALLPHVADMGWTDQAAEVSMREAGIGSDEAALAAPNGISDLIERFFGRAEEGMLAALDEQDTSALRTHEKVAAGIKAWLGALEPHREAVKRASARGFLPWNTSDAAQRTWKTADAIWTAAGDTATDYNRETKRGLLSAVLPPIVLYWQNEPDEADLDAFIAKRLENAMTFGKWGSKIAKPGLELLDRLRGRGDDG